MTQPSLLDFARGPLEFDAHAVTIAPSVHPAARETSALAAAENLPRKGSQNAEVLRVITAAGADGLSDPEMARLTGLSRQTLCARRHDLRSLLEPAARRYRHFGRWCVCWRRVTS